MGITEPGLQAELLRGTHRALGLRVARVQVSARPHRPRPTPRTVGTPGAAVCAGRQGCVGEREGDGPS